VGRPYVVADNGLLVQLRRQPDGGRNLQDENERSNAPGDEAFGRADVAFTRDLGVRDSRCGRRSPSRYRRRSCSRPAARCTFSTPAGAGRSPATENNEANGSSVQGGAGLPSQLDSRQQSVRAGAWVFDRIQAMPRLRIDPGLRVDWNGVAGETLFSPRVSVRLEAGRGYALRASAGTSRRAPATKSSCSPITSWTSRMPRALVNERALGALLGAVERAFGPGFVARVEGYYKTFDRMIVGDSRRRRRRRARRALRLSAELQSSIPADPQIVSEPVNGADGSAYGFDVYVAHEPSSASERFAGWGSYTWGARTSTATAGATHSTTTAATLSASSEPTPEPLARAGRFGARGVGLPVRPGARPRRRGQPVNDEAGNLAKYVPEVDANGLYVWTTTKAASRT